MLLSLARDITLFGLNCLVCRTLYLTWGGSSKFTWQRQGTSTVSQTPTPLLFSFRGQYFVFQYDSKGVTYSNPKVRSVSNRALFSPENSCSFWDSFILAIKCEQETFCWIQKSLRCFCQTMNMIAPSLWCNVLKTCAEQLLVHPWCENQIWPENTEKVHRFSEQEFGTIWPSLSRRKEKEIFSLSLGQAVA